MAQSKQKGVCPHCGSDEFERIDVQDDGFCTEHICRCKECKNKFKERYYLDYSHTEYEEKQTIKHSQMEMELA